MTDLEKNQTDVSEGTTGTSVPTERHTGKLDHLFRKAGDSEETRLIYQAILNFRLSEQA